MKGVAIDYVTRAYQSRAQVNEKFEILWNAVHKTIIPAMMRFIWLSIDLSVIGTAMPVRLRKSTV